MKKYEVLLLDPPWSYRDTAAAGERGAGFKYPLLTQQDLALLPLTKIAAENCALFLWCTYPKLDEVFPLLKAWDFEFKTVVFTWIKTTRHDKLHWGMGRWTRANAEIVILATRGKPKRQSAAVHSVVLSPIMRHSAKPPEVRHRIVELMGDIPRIELFAREREAGWDATGLDLDGVDVRDFLEAPFAAPRTLEEALTVTDKALLRLRATNGGSTAR